MLYLRTVVCVFKNNMVVAATLETKAMNCLLHLIKLKTPISGVLSTVKDFQIKKHSKISYNNHLSSSST